MTNLEKAYTARDSNAYKACFDQNYIGTSQDLVDQTPLDTLTFADEEGHIRVLARSTTISGVLLELKPTMVRLSSAGDPPGWALMQDPVFSLTINDGETQYIIPVQNETIEFRFIPTLDASSPTDTTWKIIRWDEIRR